MFLRNTWSVAAWNHEVDRTLLERTIIEESLCLYRKEDGTAVAIGNMCPHRFAPLSMGKLTGIMLNVPIMVYISIRRVNVFITHIQAKSPKKHA